MSSSAIAIRVGYGTRVVSWCPLSVGVASLVLRLDAHLEVLRLLAISIDRGGGHEAWSRALRLVAWVHVRRAWAPVSRRTSPSCAQSAVSKLWIRTGWSDGFGHHGCGWAPRQQGVCLTRRRLPPRRRYRLSAFDSTQNRTPNLTTHPTPHLCTKQAHPQRQPTPCVSTCSSSWAPWPWPRPTSSPSPPRCRAPSSSPSRRARPSSGGWNGEWAGR